MGNVISFCCSSSLLKTRASRLRALGLMLGLAALAIAALMWSSAAGAHVVRSPRPVISHLSLTGSGASRTLKMTLSRRATVTVVITRALAGHRVKGLCQTRAQKGRRCTLTVRVATHKYKGGRGRNSFKLQLGSLATGHYVAAVVAQNASGSSARHTLKFAISTSPPLTKALPAPPKPPTKPSPPSHYTPPSALKPSVPPTTSTTTTTSTTSTTTSTASTTTSTASTTTSTTPVTPPQAKTWGASGQATTLVVYDTTGAYGWLGELDAIAGGNLASHFGKITAEPVVDYVSGQINQYTATIYIGSTYNEPIPTTFLNDVLSTSHPVIWAGENVWQLSGTEGSSADTAFMAKYGWDPSNSNFDPTDNPTTISYKGETFTRNALNGADILQPRITNPSAVTTLAQANCTSSTGVAANCASQAAGASEGTTFPWAIRSANLTYVGEDPFSYISETDRYVAFSDLLFAALAPSAPASHQALVRLEDVSPASDPTALKQFADYFASQNVPFSVNVIPEYTDPLGYQNSSVPACAAIPQGQSCTLTLAQEPAVVDALKYMESKGGTLNEEGYTHQYSNVPNPYTAISGDDAEFYRAQCSTTQNPPYNFVPSTAGACATNDYVIWTGLLPGDSESWAAGRVSTGMSLFTQAGLTPPSVWVTPHYFASAADYAAIDSKFPMRYERETFPSGLLTGGTLNYSQTFGQFFPYVVHDAYGGKVIPENLGDYEATAQNGNPVRLPADVIHNAQVNLAVTQGVASFFYNPEDGLPNLQTIVAGVKALGYTFVGPTSTSLPGG